MLWDYHVILLVKDGHKSLVYDLDTKLPFPASFEKYCEATFGEESAITEKFRRMFRVIPGGEFLAGLSSDRRHMRRQESQEWTQPPPSWPCIRGSEETEHNLDTFISMGEGEGLGTVCDLEQFVRMFRS